MCEATTPAVVCSCLELINRHDRRKNTLMVFTKADGMALPGQWSKLCKKLLGSEQGQAQPRLELSAYMLYSMVLFQPCPSKPSASDMQRC